jgi:hypothetical protein
MNINIDCFASRLLFLWLFEVFNPTNRPLTGEHSIVEAITYKDKDFSTLFEKNICVKDKTNFEQEIGVSGRPE